MVGYNVYRATVSGGPYTKLTNTPIQATAFSDNFADVQPPPQSGDMFFYVTKSVDSTGLESNPSNEIQVRIP